MDKEQARFILRSFRPDGADGNDQDFAEALALAIEDRELGEWLAHERALDAAFASALNSVELPENLRQDIIGCLAGERNGFPQAKDAQDALWIGAIASIQAPPNLRDEILTAMSQDLGKPLTELRVDGGAAANDLLMQRQADLLGVECVRPQVLETTGLGSALLAGVAVGFWADLDAVRGAWSEQRRFVPGGDATEITSTRSAWAEAIERA